MMDRDAQCELVLLCADSPVDELCGEVRSLASDELDGRVDVDGHRTDSDLVRLVLTGPLEDVDAAHNKLRHGEFLADGDSRIRLKDEAGRRIRTECYPILAEIEEELRAFINRSMTEVLGPDWWEDFTPETARQRVEEVQERSGGLTDDHHPLEFAEFHHLTDLVTHSFRRWDDDHPLTAQDLEEVLAEAESLDHVRGKLASKREELSLWEEVFKRYMADPGAWDEFEEQLAEDVIPIRHQVMHHRPVHIYELEKVSDARDDLVGVISGARTSLTRPQRKEAAKAARAIAEISRKQQEQIAQAMEPVVEAQARQFAEISKSLDPMRQVSEDLEKMTSPLRNLSIDFPKLHLKEMMPDYSDLFRGLGTRRRSQGQEPQDGDDMADEEADQEEEESGEGSGE